MRLQLSSRRLSGRFADLFMHQPLAEGTPLNSHLRHDTTRSLGRSRRPIIHDNDAYRVSGWAYDVIFSQAAITLSPARSSKASTAGFPQSIAGVRWSLPVVIYAKMSLACYFSHVGYALQARSFQEQADPIVVGLVGNNIIHYQRRHIGLRCLKRAFEVVCETGHHADLSSQSNSALLEV